MKPTILAVLIPVFAARLPAQLVAIDPGALPLSDTSRMELSGFLRGQQWLEAETALYRSVRENPASAELRKALAAAHFRNERYLAAATEYGRAARMAPLDPGSRFTLAAAYIALERRHWARRELESLAAEYPRNPLYPHWLAGIYQHYQWFDRAIVESRKAIEINPDFSSAHDRLGQCLEALGRTAEALAAYAKAEQVGRAAGERSAWPSYHRGSLLRQGGKFEEAVAALERAAALEPRNAEVQHELGLTLDRLNRPDEALAALRVAVEAEPGEAKFHYALSRLQRRTGDIDGARASLARFQRLAGGEAGR
ncbi:MAG: tetratricopeptide repeat protein [Bryobacteraceae bacterium]